MPLPKPKKNEKKEEFINRCMSDDVMKQDYKDNDQRLAVCYDLWDRNKKNDNPDIEMRVLNVDDTEIRVDDDNPMLVGYAARTNSWTDLGFFKERIKPGAFSDVINNDVRCLKNHDPNLILGRTTNKTLRLKENSVGLHFENDIPDTTTGRDTREEVRSKLITGCSFAFTIAEEDWKYYEGEKPPERTIIKIKQLYDVGPVTYPAYPDTTVAARSLENIKKEAEKVTNDEIPAERQAEINRRLRKADFDYNYNLKEINRIKSAKD